MLVTHYVLFIAVITAAITVAIVTCYLHCCCVLPLYTLASRRRAPPVGPFINGERACHKLMASLPLYRCRTLQVYPPSTAARCMPTPSCKRRRGTAIGHLVTADGLFASMALPPSLTSRSRVRNIYPERNRARFQDWLQLQSEASLRQAQHDVGARASRCY